MTVPRHPHSPPELYRQASSLLASYGAASKDFQMWQLPGGRNNRVHCLDADGTRYLLKEYYYDSRDTRDRLASEFAFLEYAVQCSPQAVPHPLAYDAHARIGLFTYVEGTSISPDCIDATAVQQAANFYRHLNDPANIAGVHSMPLASEACFSVNDHLRCVQHRVSRLEKVTDPKARAFIKGPLAAAWKRAVSEVQHISISKEITLPMNERCISPSDFGFHNSLMQRNGQIRFLDFEYAGWDDPAKMVCDFFYQPQVPVDEQFFSIMWEAAAASVRKREILWTRVQALRPLYALKWCCIMLNDFLPVDDARRKFASSEDPAARQNRQLQKAEAFLHRNSPH